MRHRIFQLFNTCYQALNNAYEPFDSIFGAQRVFSTQMDEMPHPMVMNQTSEVLEVYKLIKAADPGLPCIHKGDLVLILGA